MAKVPSLPHKRVVRILEKAGFKIVRQGRHISIWNGEIMVIVPRNNPINRWTLKGIIEDAGLTIEKFLDLM